MRATRVRAIAPMAVTALVGALLLTPPVSGATAPVGSTPGDTWSDTTPASGTAVLSFGHVGCDEVDADGICVGGSWPTIAGAKWIWTAQMVTDAEATDGTAPTTFTKTVTGPNCPVGSITAKVTIAADDHYDLTFNGSLIGSGSLTPKTYEVAALAGANDISVTVTGDGAPSSTPAENPAGLAYAVSFTCSVSATKVVATSADEWAGAASTTVTAWTVWTGKKNIAFAKPVGGRRITLNARGTEGWVHSVDGYRVIYQQYSHDTGVSDIYIFNAKTERRKKVGGASSRAWEYHPGLSGTKIAFARWFPSSDRRLYLYDTETRSTRVVASTSGKRKVLALGQVNGRWITYEIYTFDANDHLTSNNVYRYDIVTRQTVKVPNPGGGGQWGPSVTSSGLVFYRRGSLGCGGSSIFAYPIDGAAVAMFNLPSNRDFGKSFAREGTDGRVDVFFDPAVCGRQQDIMVIGVVPGASSAAGVSGSKEPRGRTSSLMKPECQVVSQGGPPVRDGREGATGRVRSRRFRPSP